MPGWGGPRKPTLMVNCTGFRISQEARLLVCLGACFQRGLREVRRPILNVGSTICRVETRTGNKTKQNQKDIV